MADFSNRWQAILTTSELASNINVASKIPHCLKQNGMAKMLTPMMLLAIVTMNLNVMLKLSRVWFHGLTFTLNSVLSNIFFCNFFCDMSLQSKIKTNVFY
jgi:hypothetical protein